jgi:hypothetical protein
MYAPCLITCIGSGAHRTIFILKSSILNCWMFIRLTVARGNMKHVSEKRNHVPQSLMSNHVILVIDSMTLLSMRPDIKQKRES